ncbi:hypothetical protein BDZ89DRAFT_1182465 [Hymenopellis radicata]|nr:hypothetical protein BDZ89DRAFT_1182465 [Hymenopellis radicata]
MAYPNIGATVVDQLTDRESKDLCEEPWTLLDWNEQSDEVQLAQQCADDLKKAMTLLSVILNMRKRWGESARIWKLDDLKAEARSGEELARLLRECRIQITLLQKQLYLAEVDPDGTLELSYKADLMSRLSVYGDICQGKLCHVWHNPNDGAFTPGSMAVSGWRADRRLGLKGIVGWRVWYCSELSIADDDTQRIIEWWGSKYYIGIREVSLAADVDTSNPKEMFGDLKAI